MRTIKTLADVTEVRQLIDAQIAHDGAKFLEEDMAVQLLFDLLLSLHERLLGGMER